MFALQVKHQSAVISTKTIFPASTYGFILSSVNISHPVSFFAAFVFFDEYKLALNIAITAKPQKHSIFVMFWVKNFIEKIAKKIGINNRIKFKELSNDKEFFVVYDKQQNRLKELEEEWANKTEELEELI